MHEDLRDISMLFDIYEVLGLRHRKKSILCPLPMHEHKNYTPSFSIMPGMRQNWKCHGSCNKHGDVIDLMGHLKIPGYDDKNPKHIAQAVSYLQRGFTSRVPEPEPPQPGLQLKVWHDHELPGEGVINYLAARGIGKDAIEYFDIRQKNNYAAVATFENKRLVSIKYRKAYGEGHRFFSATGTRPGLFNFDRVDGRREPLLILKSETAAIFMWQYHPHVCAFTGGENMDIPEKYFYPMSAAKKRVYVGDNDENPKTREIVRKYAANRGVVLDAEVHYPPDEFKDIDDWIRARPEDISIVKGWLE